MARLARYFSGICLLLIGLILVGTAYAVFNHPPTVSWLGDQRTTDRFQRQYFRIWDNEQPLTAASISVTSTNPSFTNPIGITWGICTPDDLSKGCPSDGGYYIDFPNPPGNSPDPSATVRVKVGLH